MGAGTAAFGGTVPARGPAPSTPDRAPVERWSAPAGRPGEGRRIGVLAVQGAFAAHRDVLQALGAEVVEVRTPDDLARVDAIVIPGGESTTISMMLEFNGLLEPLRAAIVERSMPALGTCAGMIVLSATILDGRDDQHCLGAIDLAVRRNAFGRQVDSFETDLDVAGLDGGPFPAVFIRAPVVADVGRGVEVLAEVDGQPVLCRQGRVLVAAFHPELSGDDRLHRELLELVGHPAGRPGAPGEVPPDGGSGGSRSGPPAPGATPPAHAGPGPGHAAPGDPAPGHAAPGDPAPGDGAGASPVGPSPRPGPGPVGR